MPFRVSVINRIYLKAKKRYIVSIFLVLYVGLYVCFKGQISGILRTITLMFQELGQL